MAPRHEARGPRDEREEFAEFVAKLEGRKEKPFMLTWRNLWFLLGAVGGVAAAVIGAVWGIAMAFGSFRFSQDLMQKEIVHLRKHLADVDSETMRLKELDLWADAFQYHNQGKVDNIPKPSDYKVKRPVESEE